MFMTLRQTGSLLEPFLPVLQHLNLFQCDETTGHHAIKHRQELVDLCLGVHDLHHDGKVKRQSKHLGSMQPAGVPETHRTTKNRCARQMHASGFLQNGFVKRLMLKAIILSEEDAQERSSLGTSMFRTP